MCIVSIRASLSEVTGPACRSTAQARPSASIATDEAASTDIKDEHAHVSWRGGSLNTRATGHRHIS